MTHFPLSPIPAHELATPPGSLEPADDQGISIASVSEFTLTLPGGGPTASGPDGRRRASGVILDFYWRFDTEFAGEIDLEVSINGAVCERVLLTNDAPFSAVVIDSGELSEAENAVCIAATDPERTAPPGEWRLRIFAFNKAELWPAVCSRMVWMLGSARSGTTWLANMMCQGDGVLPMDETGLGRMLGAHRWEPERWFPDSQKIHQPWGTPREVSGHHMIPGAQPTPPTIRAPLGGLVPATAVRLQPPGD